MCKLHLCLTPPCNARNHNLLRGVELECFLLQMHKLAAQDVSLAPVSYFFFFFKKEKRLQDECSYWQEVRQRASENSQKNPSELGGTLNVSWHLQHNDEKLWV